MYVVQVREVWLGQVPSLGYVVACKRTKKHTPLPLSPFEPRFGACEMICCWDLEWQGCVEMSPMHRCAERTSNSCYG